MASMERPIESLTGAKTSSVPFALTRTRGREKPQLSCNFCRKRKLRCDRKQPCESCVRLGQASACRFAIPQASRKLSAQTPQDTLQSRIIHLESLVRSFATSPQPKPTASNHEGISSSEPYGHTGDKDPIAHRFGRMDLRAQESSYVESSHWTAILDEIGELKDMIQEQSGNLNEEDLSKTQVRPGLDLFMSDVPLITKMEILAVIPPRHLVDGMIAKYFKKADMPIHLAIHRKVFFKQYNEFWENPFDTPVLWVCILLGMMLMVASTALFVDAVTEQLDEDTLLEYQNIISTYRDKMIQCLRIGNYMKGSPHTIEALLFFLQVEFVQGDDPEQGCWQLIGVIVRVALKMGYHRDASHFPQLSFFEAEMRRRLWYILLQFDTASASEVGLPRLIKQAQCDTTEPHNLFDDDFDDTTTTQPPERPPTEHTLCQFLKYKSRIVTVYGAICDFTTSSQQSDYEEVMGLDSALNEAYARKPHILELKPMQQSILDGAELITRRMYIALAYHQAQMTLHRKFMVLAKTNDRYAKSYTTSIDAALAVLQLQNDMFEQCKPGRILQSVHWKVMLLIQSEFLLAATVLCLDLVDDFKKGKQNKTLPQSMETTRNRIAALHSSHDIWKQQRRVPKQAQTAMKVISFVLAKIQETTEAPPPYIFPEYQPMASSPGSFTSEVDRAENTNLANVPFDMDTFLESNTGRDLFDLNEGWEKWFHF